MTLHDDLTTVTHALIDHDVQALEAHRRVEAEIARLREELDEKRSAIRYKHEDLEAAEAEVARLERERNEARAAAWDAIPRAEAAEAEIARLRDGLREPSVEFACANGHRWFMPAVYADEEHPEDGLADEPRRCPVCGTITFARALLAEDGAA